MTNGVFDIKKEAEIVGNIVVDAIMHPKIISRENSDRAFEIVKEKFLVFRSSAPNIPVEEINTKEESAIIAKIIIDALTGEGLIDQKNIDLAFEIAAEEILVRRCMESL